MTSPTWAGDEDYIAQRRPRGLDWWRVVRRGLPGVFVITICLVLLLTLRPIERPLFGAQGE